MLPTCEPMRQSNDVLPTRPRLRRLAVRIRQAMHAAAGAADAAAAPARGVVDLEGGGRGGGVWGVGRVAWVG